MRAWANRPWVRFAGLLSLAAVAAVVSLLWLGEGNSDFVSLRGDTRLNVLVITIDTLRADRLPAYGFTGVQTPTMNALASRGVLFRRASSTTPLTLPAHTTIFSGTYPPHHGVRDNGGFIVPESLTTLAELLHDRDYATAGFVAAYVLDARWGLDQGFDTYVDDFDVGGERIIAMGGVQRPANEVVDSALEWLDTEATGNAPFFLWTHLYDPHAPYEPPEPYRSLYPGQPYLGEIAFTDSQIDRLLDGLRARGDLNNTIVVLAADHGESLGEHGETQHGFFIYEEATHVPLIFSVPYAQLHGIERSEVVSLADIMPTVLEMIGVEAPAEIQGKSLLPLFARDGAQAGGVPEPRYVYSESYYARYHFGWSELAAIQDGRHKLIISPEPELYDLVVDPDEANNLLDGSASNALYARMSADADRLIAALGVGAAGAAPSQLDGDTRAKLASLGYLGSFQADDDGTELESPRAKIGIYNRSIEARQLMQRERYDEAEALLHEIINEDPRVIDAYTSLGELYTQQQSYEQAAAASRAAIALKPTDPYAHTFLAESEIALGRLDDAERTALGALEFIEDAPQIYHLLGEIKMRQQNYPRSVEYFNQCLSLNPDSSPAFAGLAAVKLLMGDPASAEQHARRALDINATAPGVHFTLAQALARNGRPEEAMVEYQRQLEDKPQHIGALFNLAMYHRENERESEEEQYLARVLEVDSEHALANLFMARILMRRGQELGRALQMVKAAVAQSLERRDLTLGHFLLADLYNRLGQPELSLEHARRAEALRR